MKYASPRNIAIWHGQIQGHMQAIQFLSLPDELNYEQRQAFLSSMSMIQLSCKAIEAALTNAKEV